MPITWPAELPQLPNYGWTEAQLDNTVRSETDTGPAKVRPRFTKANRRARFGYHLTAAQVAILDSFHSTTLASGSLRFDMVHPRTGLTHAFRFLEPYEATEIAEGFYVTTLALEFLP